MYIIPKSKFEEDYLLKQVGNFLVKHNHLTGDRFNYAQWNSPNLEIKIGEKYYTIFAESGSEIRTDAATKDLHELKIIIQPSSKVKFDEERYDAVPTNERFIGR